MLGFEPDGLGATVRARRGAHLPVVLSVPEVAALLQTLSVDPRAGIVRRHHISDSVIQKAVKSAAHAAQIHKPVSVHTLRHCFATHLLLNGVDIRQIQQCMGHANVETTMIYTHVVKELRNPARSLADLLQDLARR